MNCVEAKVSKADAGTAGAADDDKKRMSGTNLGGVTFVEDKRLRACDALARFGPAPSPIWAAWRHDVQVTTIAAETHFGATRSGLADMNAPRTVGHLIKGSATGAARPPGWSRRRRSARPRRMRSGGRTRAANRPASAQSQPPHELSNGHIGQRLSKVGRASCRVKPSFQLPLHVRLRISLTSNAVRLTAIRTPLRTDPRADLKHLLRQHHYLACREPNSDFEQTHLRRRILMRLKFVVVPGVLGSVSAQLLRRKEARLAKKSGEQPNEPRGSVSPVAAAEGRGGLDL